jgi:hypothetical protein
MSASNTRTDPDTSSPLVDATCDECSVIVFKGCQAGVEQFAFGNDDDVKARRDLVPTENLSYQAFCAVSLHRSAQLLRRRDSKPPDASVVGKHEQGGVAAVNPHAALVNLLELRTAAKVLGRTKSHENSPLSPTRADAIRC